MRDANSLWALCPIHCIKLWEQNKISADIAWQPLTIIICFRSHLLSWEFHRSNLFQQGVLWFESGWCPATIHTQTPNRSKTDSALVGAALVLHGIYLIIKWETFNKIVSLFFIQFKPTRLWTTSTFHSAMPNTKHPRWTVCTLRTETTSTITTTTPPSRFAVLNKNWMHIP